MKAIIFGSDTLFSVLLSNDLSFKNIIIIPCVNVMIVLYSEDI